MAPLPARPVFVVVPGASQSPAQYAAMMARLQEQGYPCLSALLPSTGSSSQATVEEDAAYVRDRMLLPMLDTEGHDVVLVTHSYSGLPGSAAARGLSKNQRLAKGKSTGIIGQIHLAAILSKGGDGKDLLTTFGGQLPPHMRADEPVNLIRCDDRIPPLMHDLPEPLADASARGLLCPSLTSFTSPIPPASWDEPGYAGRCAYIRTIHDAAIPLAIQDQMLAGTGQQWIVKDMDTSHGAQIAAPETFCTLLVELVQHFSTL